MELGCRLWVWYVVVFNNLILLAILTRHFWGLNSMMQIIALALVDSLVW
jgi:hypothetical protein